ncbi:hypothetical protein PHLGIDRAFT_113393 [Phlebiopsis gigantea 11061_1 CR5-6]|uniref:BTB domain-containing protein n=1 Tax=Phlebiopsis gigantea (strain 11061_1 CR5-6) TaxID=745531 RepID=A0A0C3P4A4_PHLG1|nr:hypothetical protein PHLGIDRAFT_113393 [Phlebiopsis gigantea 11061_1 CR5-6]
MAVADQSVGLRARHGPRSSTKRMTEIPRQGSPRIASTGLALSPNRPSPLSGRPHWPYSTYSHAHRPSSSSSSISGSSVTLPAMPVWDLRPSGSTSVGTSSPAGLVRRLSTGPAAQDDNTRHWSFTAFEWIVRDVHRLRDYMENMDAGTEATDFDVLRESPMLGDGKFKLEIAYKPPADIPEGSKPQLSLFVTSVMLEYAHTDYEICTSMFAGIKCQEDRAGERGARSDWAWEYWQNDWVFREDSEVWECPLPPLSDLLDNTRIRHTDSFVICVQIHCPVGPFFPQQPSAAYVPKELLDGLEALLDNANTGDVQFVCLERREDEDAEANSPTVANSPDTPLATPQSGRSSTASSTTTSFLPHRLARKRVIYAHSDILIRRSEYFATMLNSSFSETSALPGERKTYTIVVEEADFATIYWLLKWVYANWLLFKEHDNPKAAIDGVGVGWSVRWLDSPRRAADEWAWTPFSTRHAPSEGGDARSVTSAESGPAKKGKAPASTAMPKGSIAPSPVRRAATTATGTTAPATLTVAHRYGMPGLAALALEHMMATLTPAGSFALLLASATWEELHRLVEDYVVEKWDEVSVSDEFEQCCQEVAAGEWGTEGGKTLTALFRRLRAPR